MAGDLVTLLEALVDRYDDDLMRSELRRQDKTIVIGVAHDEGTHQTGRYPPGRSPDIFLLSLLVGEEDIEGLGEVLTQEVRRPAL